MAGRGRSGSEPMVEQREAFVSLIAAGVSNSAACCEVGVNRRIGTRWRDGPSLPGAGGGVLQWVAGRNGAAAADPVV